MRVLFTTPILEHPPAGGPQLRIENSIKALSRECERVILVDWPYNQGPLPQNAHRVSDWPEVVRRVAEYGESLSHAPAAARLGPPKP